MPDGFDVAAFYRFVELADREPLRDSLLARCVELDIRGTILLAHEGINATIAGPPASIANLHAHFDTVPELAQMTWKISHCTEQPFKRMVIKRKKEIVTMGIADLQIAGHVGTYVPPKDWDALIAREDVVVIDTRNTYEMEEGTFTGAINPQLKNFRQFPAWIDQQCDINHDQPVAMFCTGGIRCEKATALLRQRGFRNVYHLEGGILAYLEQTKNPQGSWKGTCFVFDGRGTVDEKLQPAPRTVYDPRRA
jgi:UPF0176 protein